MKTWYVLDTKKPYLKIREIQADVKHGEKLAYVIEYFRERKRMYFVGLSAFPTYNAAMASQNFRCHQNIIKITKGLIYRKPILHDVLVANEDRLNLNFKEMRLHYGSKIS